MKFYDVTFYVSLFLFFLGCSSCVPNSGESLTESLELKTPFQPWNNPSSLENNIDFRFTTDYMTSRPPRLVAQFRSDWTFNYFPSNLENKAIAELEFDDTEWPVISIPHTWQTYETTKDLHPYIKHASERDDPYWWRGWGYYRKRFDVSERLKDKQIFIEFDGVQKYSKIYLNGKFIGDHKGGYTSFSFDVTEAVNWAGENILSVMVNNFRRDKFSIPPMTAGNWNVYGGIYRDVRLVIKNKVHIPYQGNFHHPGGTFVSTPKVSREEAFAKIITYIRNNSNDEQRVVLSTTIQSPEGVIVDEILLKKTIAANKTADFEQLSKSIKRPKLWHPDTPELYKVISEVYVDNVLQDTYESHLGFRFFRWDYEQDVLYVNGEKMNIKGTNRHQEYPWLGDAIPDWIQKKDMIDIKYGLGHNFMRAAHYPNDPLIYDLADQLGIIMVEEVPNIKNIDFNEEVQEQNVREMIRRDRNHPSIFFWSMGNETSDGADSRWAVDEDTTRIIHARKAEEVGEFVEHDHTNLDMENLLRVTIHGWYTSDDAPDSINVTPENGQHAGSETWQHQMAMKRGGSVRGILNDNTMAWLYEDHGADREYQNTPVLHINPKGWVDSYRIPKYIYFLNKANYLDEPVLFIHPHFWRKQYLGQFKDLTIDSNCDEIEILVNGISKGFVYPGSMEFKSVIFENLKIEKGTITAKGKKGDKSIEVELVMPGEPERIILKSTHDKLSDNNAGIAVLTAYVVDNAGNVVFDSKNVLNWEVSGPANLLGTDKFTTDIDKHEAMEGTGYISGPVSNIIRTNEASGQVMVKVTSPGLKEAEIGLNADMVEQEQNDVVQFRLNNKSRQSVVRVEGFVEKIAFRQVIKKVTGNQQFQGNNINDYRKAIDAFVRERNNELDVYPLGYQLFLNQISQNLSKLNGLMIADDFNFMAEQFNNYVMLANTIETSNLHVEYARKLKESYAKEILENNRQLDFQHEVDFVQSIPKTHVPLYIEKPNEDNIAGEVEDDYVTKSFNVWSHDAIQGIEIAFPAYKDLSENDQEVVYQYIARITPEVSYNAETKKFKFNNERLLIIPGPDVRAIIKDLKSEKLGQFLEN